MAVILRHRYEPRGNAWGLCFRCGKVKGNIIHRLGGRCSMCFKYYRHYELDSSRRCDECRP
jgi:hypothetical protein